MLPCFLAALLCASSCASTRVETTGQPLKKSLCETAGAKIPVSVSWRPQWRPNQKDITERERAAETGIRNFFSESSCFTLIALQRLDATATAEIPRAGKPHLQMLIEVRELGPVVRLFSTWALLDGGTEVVFSLKILSNQDAPPLAELDTHWQNGGHWVLKGVKSLPDDMKAALQAALEPTQSRDP